jgi:hypothetical protein
MLLGLLLFAFTAGLAQTPSQGDQKKTAEACCAMDSCCCCSGDSCQMKEHGAAAMTTSADVAVKTDAAKPDCCKGDSCKMHKKDMNHAEGHECCGCCADSCDMDMKADGTMKHDMKDMKHDMKDCCKAKAKDAKDKNKQ